MILLAGRNLGAGLLAAQIAGTGADFLIRVKTGRLVSLSSSSCTTCCPTGSSRSAVAPRLILSSSLPSTRIR